MRVPNWVMSGLESWYAERIEPAGLRPERITVGEVLDDASFWFCQNGVAELDQYIRSKRMTAFLRGKGVEIRRGGACMMALGIRLRASSGSVRMRGTAPWVK